MRSKTSRDLDMDKVLRQVEYTEASIHEFKNNISRYIRALEAGRHKAVIVKRYDIPVGVFIPYRAEP